MIFNLELILICNSRGTNPLQQQQQEHDQHQPMISHQHTNSLTKLETTSSDFGTSDPSAAFESSGAAVRERPLGVAQACVACRKLKTKCEAKRLGSMHETREPLCQLLPSGL